MKNLFELISLKDAITRYHIHQKIYEDEADFNALVEPDSYFYVHEGDLRLDEDFILDTGELTNASRDKWICGYIAVNNGGLLKTDIPERFYEYELLLAALRKKDFQIEMILAIFMTEDMLVEYVKIGRGAYLDHYCKTYGISKQAVLYWVIAADIRYLQNIFGWHLSLHTYQYAKSLYDNEIHKAQWEAFLQQFSAKIQRVLKA